MLQPKGRESSSVTGTAAWTQPVLKGLLHPAEPVQDCHWPQEETTCEGLTPAIPYRTLQTGTALTPDSAPEVTLNPNCCSRGDISPRLCP